MNALIRAFGLFLAILGAIIFYLAYGYGSSPANQAIGYLISALLVMIGLILFVTSSRKD